MAVQDLFLSAWLSCWSNSDKVILSGILNCTKRIMSGILIPIPTHPMHIQIRALLCRKSSMTLILVFAFRLKVIDWIIPKVWFLLHTQSGSLDRKYFCISIVSSILLTNIIILGISFIRPCLDTKKAKSWKPNFQIEHTIYLRFDRSKDSL